MTPPLAERRLPGEGRPFRGMVPSPTMNTRRFLAGFVLAAALPAGASAAPAAPSRIDAATAERFANLALSCVHKEYPNKIAHVLSGDADVKPPRELTPSFYGCYDWHSAFHGTWLPPRPAAPYPVPSPPAKAREHPARART